MWKGGNPFELSYTPECDGILMRRNSTIAQNRILQRMGEILVLVAEKML